MATSFEDVICRKRAKLWLLTLLQSYHFCCLGLFWPLVLGHFHFNSFFFLLCKISKFSLPKATSSNGKYDPQYARFFLGGISHWITNYYLSNQTSIPLSLNSRSHEIILLLYFFVFRSYRHIKLLHVTNWLWLNKCKYISNGLKQWQGVMSTIYRFCIQVAG